MQASTHKAATVPRLIKREVVAVASMAAKWDPEGFRIVRINSHSGRARRASSKSSISLARSLLQGRSVYVDASS
jgi:hypothetical protein